MSAALRIHYVTLRASTKAKPQGAKSLKRKSPLNFNRQMLYVCKTIFRASNSPQRSGMNFIFHSLWSRAQLGAVVIATFLIAACDQSSVAGAGNRSSDISPKQTGQKAPESQAIKSSTGQRELECKASEVFWPYCYVDGWEGHSPSNLINSGRGDNARWQGLDHVLQNGSSRRLKLFFDKNTGACGEVIEATGAHRGSTYTGVFYCNKTPFLPTASDLPEKTASSENILVGKWTKSAEEKWVKTLDWEFLADGSLQEGEEKLNYKFFGPSFATKKTSDNKWWVYQITSVTNDRVLFTNAGFDGLTSVVYTLTKADRSSSTVVAPIPSAVIATHGQSPTPSFDCRKASSTSEKLICSDTELSQLDSELAVLYKAAKAAAPNGEEFRKESAAEWKIREQTCGDRACLIQW